MPPPATVVISALMQAALPISPNVYESVRHFLRRRHQVQTRGTNRFSIAAVFGELGVLQLGRVHVEPRS